MFKQIGRLGFAISTTLFVLFHFLELFFSEAIFLSLISFFGLLTLFFGILILNHRAILLPLILLIVAIVIGLAHPSASFSEVFWVGASKMRSLLPMLFVIPFVAWVLKQENYVEDTILLMKRQLKSSRTFYGLLIFMTQIISFFLLFGSIVVVYQIATTFFKGKVSPTWEVFKSTAVLRGFSFSSMWVVSMPSFAYTVAVLQADLIHAFIQGLLVGVAGLLLGIVHLHFYEKKQKISLSSEIREVIAKAEEKRSTVQNGLRNPIEFAVLFSSLIILTFVANALLPLDLLAVIPFVVIVWVVTYFIVKRRMRALFQEIKQYFSKRITSNAPQWVLLLATGILIVALDTSGLSEAAMQGVYQWSESALGINFLWILPLIVLMLGFLGVGPLSVTVLIAGIVLSIYLPYEPELIVLAMTLGSALSILLSPIVIPTILLSGVNQKNPFENSVLYNWKFAITFYFLVETYIQIRLLF